MTGAGTEGGVVLLFSWGDFPSELETLRSRLLDRSDRWWWLLFELLLWLFTLDARSLLVKLLRDEAEDDEDDDVEDDDEEDDEDDDDDEELPESDSEASASSSLPLFSSEAEDSFFYCK